MGIADVREAFQRGLGAAGQCTDARMDYEQGGAMQILTFTVAGRGEAKVAVSASGDLITAAEAAGREMAAG